MKKRILGVVLTVLMAFAMFGVATSLAHQSGPRTVAAASSKCKKCKKIVKKAKKCKKQHNHSAKCKKTIKKAKKCKKLLKSRKCKTPAPSASPSGSPGGGGSGKQSFEGSIAQPAPYPPDGSCYAGKHRRETVLAGDANQGVDGYHFDVDPKTYGKNFVLKVTGGEADVDLDIIYYTEFGDQMQAADPQYAPPNQGFETRGPGGEAGTVPANMKVAIVCMTAGVNATFTYDAGTGVETPK